VPVTAPRGRPRSRMVVDARVQRATTPRFPRRSDARRGPPAVRGKFYFCAVCLTGKLTGEVLMTLGALFIVTARSAVVAMLLAGCASIKETTYEAEFDPPRTYIDFMGSRVPRETLDEKLIEDGLAIAKRLGFDVEFVTAVNSVGCDDLCFLYRQKHVD